MKKHLLDLAYRAEVLFSRLQGIAFDHPQLNGEYRLIRVLRSVTKVAVDAGANRGDWTAELLRQVPSARVVCIEPEPGNAEYIRSRFAAQANVTVEPVAVGGDNGKSFFLPEGGAGSGLGHVVSTAYPLSIEVPTRTLDTIAKERDFSSIDLVKCDVEGSELPALCGAECLFRTGAVGSMQIEYNATWIAPGHRLIELYEFAADYRYALLLATPLGFMECGLYGIGVEDFRMRNFVLSREDHIHLLKPFPPAGRARVETIRAATKSASTTTKDGRS